MREMNTGRLEHVQREELSNLAADICRGAQLAVSGSDVREAGMAVEVVLSWKSGMDRTYWSYFARVMNAVVVEFDDERALGLDHSGHLALSSQVGSHCVPVFGVGVCPVELVDVDV